MNRSLGTISDPSLEITSRPKLLVVDDLDLPDKLLAFILENGIAPSQVMIEVTESSVMGNLQKTLDVLTRLRMKGINLSIDDFGTGYSPMPGEDLLNWLKEWGDNDVFFDA